MWRLAPSSVQRGIDWRSHPPYPSRPRVDPAREAGPGGGIGRRAGFRCQWLNGRGGSSPLLGTNPSLSRELELSPIVTIHLHDGDLPDGVSFGASVAIDSETMGLRLGRDPLCVVQLSAGDGDAHVVRLSRPDYDAPNLKRLLTDPGVVKIFHFGRFDIAMFLLHLGVVTAPVYCTKIASKLVRTYTDRHGLKDLTRELLGIDMSKAQQSSDWGAPKLTSEQVSCAASDVTSLHALRNK